MRLTQMQDIGGGRAVLDSVESVYQLKESYLNKRRQYEVVHIDDYIRSPKSSGYRSIHLVLKYKSKKYPEYNNLLRSEEHTSELQSLMRISYAVFCLKKKRCHLYNLINHNQTHHAQV